MMNFKDDAHRFDWTRFYESFAIKLLPYRNKRPELVAKLHEIFKSDENMEGFFNRSIEQK